MPKTKFGKHTMQQNELDILQVFTNVNQKPMRENPNEK